MMKIEAFEQIIENNIDPRDKGINPTVVYAYRDSLRAENDLIDFHEVIWDKEIEAITETFKSLGVKEFTISSTFSSLIATLAEFQKHGFTMAGLTEVNATYRSVFTNEREKLPAIKMVMM